jgi:hypothetical protein
MPAVTVPRIRSLLPTVLLQALLAGLLGIVGSSGLNPFLKDEGKNGCDIPQDLADTCDPPYGGTS